MSNKKDTEDGVWRTVGGRRIFIRNGVDLPTAMRESGKFDNVIKETPSRKYNSDVSFICKIRGIYEIEKEYGKLKNHDVVLTDERKQHILLRRGKKDYEVIMKNLSKTLKDYDYVYDDSRGSSKGVCYVKKLSDKRYCAIMTSLSLKKENQANSNITGILFNNENYKRYAKNRKMIAKRNK